LKLCKLEEIRRKTQVRDWSKLNLEDKVKYLICSSTHYFKIIVIKLKSMINKKLILITKWINKQNKCLRIKRK
jgi:hypothetical protein